MKFFQTVFSSLLLLVSSSRAHATTFVDVPFTQTLDETTTLVRGTVERIYAHWGQDSDAGAGSTDKRIYTYVELKVREVFKGKVDGAYFVFRQMGGEVEGTGMQIAGAAQFKVGEDIVVTTAKKNADGSYDLIGLMQGKYEVRQDPDSGEEFLVGAGTAGHEDGHKDGTKGDHAHGHSDGHSGPSVKKWSLVQLRAHLANAEPQDAPSPKNASDSPQMYPSTEAVQNDEPVASPLQNKSEGVDNAPETYGWGLLGIAAFAALILLVLLLRSKK